METLYSNGCASEGKNTSTALNRRCETLRRDLVQVYVRELHFAGVAYRSILRHPRSAVAEYLNRKRRV